MNLNMAWIDYKKAYDMVPHSWILESVTLVGIADNFKRLLKNSIMGNWKTQLNAYGTMESKSVLQSSCNVVRSNILTELSYQMHK